MHKVTEGLSEELKIESGDERLCGGSMRSGGGKFTKGTLLMSLGVCVLYGDIKA